MDQENLKNHLNSLERKITLLLGEHKSLKEKIKFLQVENEELKVEIRSREDQFDDFQNQIKISKLVDKIGSGEQGTTELKKKIDSYIREIDKCIAHLSK